MIFEEPLVSVLMTAYNRENYIAEAIESVLSSTYQNLEIIIVDDNSKDRTFEIAQSFASKDNRIKIFRNNQNVGDYPNRNRAAGYAKGEYLMHVDSDDKILENGISSCVKTMINFPNASFGIHYHDYSKAPFELNGIKAIRTHFFEKPFLQIGPGGTIIKRKYFEMINKFPEKYGPANDMYFNLKACTKTAIVMLPFEFLFYRRHEGQEINNTYSYMYNNYLYLNDALNELSMDLTKDELFWLGEKNKRRFIVNLFKYLLKSRNIRKTNDARLKAKFTIGDFVQGIFHI